MAMRISGLYSGLDTDEMVSSLMSAYSTKKNNLVKEQTKLSWTQDVWKDINSKIYDFYSKTLSNARFESFYNTQKTTISDSSYAKINSNSQISGTQTLEIEKLAQNGYLTGAKLAQTTNGSTKLSELTGVENYVPGTVSVRIGDETKIIELTENMTVSDLMSSLKKAGVNVSLDSINQRIFIGSKHSGQKNDFEITANDEGALKTLNALGLTKESGAVKVDGQDSQIKLNGVTYTNESNSYNINGLEFFTTKETNGEKLQISTQTNTDEIYKKVVGFIEEYNTLLKDMQNAYNADSASGYEPLTDEEKELMSESQVKQWEDKIKNSLLRNDQTLYSVMGTLKNEMSSITEINGNKYSLSSFGIVSKNYFSSSKNERGTFEITPEVENKLRKAIEENPNDVVEYFSTLSNNLYKNIETKMSSTSYRSSYSVYNDKQIAQNLKRYDREIADWDLKIAKKEEYYYKQFTAMEKALAQMNAQSNSLTNLFSSFDIRG